MRAKTTEIDHSAQAATDQTIRRLKADYDRLQARIETMYMDRLDGRITLAFYDAKTAEWPAQQRAIQTQIAAAKPGLLRSNAEIVGILEAVSRASATFGELAPADQRETFSKFVREATRRGGELQTVLAEPYAMLAHSNSASQREQSSKSDSTEF